MEEEGDALPKAKGQLLTQRVGRARGRAEHAEQSEAKRRHVDLCFAHDRCKSRRACIEKEPQLSSPWNRKPPIDNGQDREHAHTDA